ncbi:NOB1 family endonuclease [Sulfurisphaera tokodaii]|uniref:PIN domain-containing protein n=2 Tax=Sulfurisphaera tokodaii TaxID=111955 RepID=Q96YN5_SULTO|nr:hypothetical protein [Sulfurisphaera tokodaii]BAB67242.1 hypothetical protein STK_21370 [Sulfurisphaera tokodaii str. 7]HII72971.1 DNA-binding protein [Sulfurisphaera tokodaii]
MDYSHKIVFDTGAFLAGLQNYYEKIYTNSLVINEIKDKKSRELLDLAIMAGKIIIMEPEENTLKKTKKIAEKISAYNLSKTDLSIAALAYELRPSIVFTDDLTLQNLLLNLGIEFKSVKLNIRIRNRKKYKFTCKACGKTFSRSYSSCPYCGNTIIVVSYNE